MPARFIAVRIFSACLVTLTLSNAAVGKSLLLRDAKLVDPQHKTITQRDILIVDGKISNAKPSATDPPQVMNCKGKWVIPGLVDLHVHCSGNTLPDGSFQELGARGTAKVMLFAGVCAYLDLANSHYADLFHTRDEQRLKPADEADIYCTGTAFGRWNLSSAEEADHKIPEYIQKWKPDVIKLIYGRDTLRKEVLTAAIHAANKAGTKTVVHIGSWQHAQDAIEAGATCVTHLFDDEVISDETLQLWVKNHTVSIPTMAVQSDMYNFARHPSLLESPLLKEMANSQLLQSYKDHKHYSDKANETVEWQGEDMKNDFRSFAKLAKAGVTILAGSDTNNLGTIQGYSLHRELKLMQDAGFTPWQALAAGTTGADQFLGRNSGIESGDAAELVVLNSDPTANIANTQSIFAVIHHGHLIDRPALLK